MYRAGRALDSALLHPRLTPRYNNGQACRFARDREIPYLGICLGMQCAVIEFARSVLQLSGANSTEFEAGTQHPVICMLEEQLKVTHKGGTMRLGAQPCVLEEGSRAATCYGANMIHERHRHRYEFNSDYQRAFEAAGFVVTTADSVAALFERYDLDNAEVLMVVAFLLFNMLDGAIQDGIPPLEALNVCLTDIRNCVTDQLAQPGMPTEVHMTFRAGSPSAPLPVDVTYKSKSPSWS